MSPTPEGAGAPRERVRIWLLLFLTILVGAASYLGVPFRDYPIGVSPLPYLSMLYLITGIYESEPLPAWPLLADYCGFFLFWIITLISFSPVRLNFTFFGPISLLCLANVAWIIGYGAADVPTRAAVVTSALMFAWFAYGAFPLLPGVWD